MKNIRVGLVVGAALTVAASSQAKTLAWYHFNEAGSGAIDSGSATVLNAAAAGIADLKAGAMEKSSTYPQKILTGADYDKYLPRYDSAFPEHFTWRDRLSATTGTDNRGVYFGTEIPTGEGIGSVLYTTDTATFKTSSFTFECFVKCDYVGQPDHWKTIAAMTGIDNESAWALRVYGNTGLICCRMRVNGRNVDFAANANTQQHSILDGKWHHLALTFDGRADKMMAALYVDYVQVRTQEVAEGVTYADGDSMFQIGAFEYNNYGRYRGWVDEVRLSDEVLDPFLFLRPAGFAENGVSDADTRLYLSFDRMADASFFGSAGEVNLVNEVSNGHGYGVRLMTGASGRIPDVESVGLPAAFVHGGYFSDTDKADEACWNFKQDTVGCSSLFYVDDLGENGTRHEFAASDFTMEAYLKVDTVPAKSQYVVCAHKNGGARSMWLVLQTDNVLMCYVHDEMQDKDVKVAQYNSIADSKWHHVALVVSRQARTAALYVDYALVGTQLTDVSLPTTVDPRDGYCCLQVAGGYGVTGALDLGARLDEFRLTQRPLAWYEFLRDGRAGTNSAEVTRAWIGFDGNLAVEPKPADAAVGVPASGSANYASTTWKARVADGDGTVLKEKNVSSMRFDAGIDDGILFGRNALLELDMCSMTVEFFMKGDAAPSVAWSSLLHFNVGKTRSDETIWSVRYIDTDGSLGVRVDSDLGDEGINQYVNASGIPVNDGRWHHIAVTFEAVEDNTKTEVKIYKDHDVVSTKTLNGLLKAKDVSETSLSVGSTGYAGLLDEVRISKGVLPVSEMLYPARDPNVGFMLLFR